MTLRNIYRIVPFLFVFTLTAVSCSENEDTSVDEVTDVELPVETIPSDLPLFELRGDVKQCKRTIFHHVAVDSTGCVVGDSSAGFKSVTMMFDRRNHFVPGKYEKIKRDSAGRICRWEDRTPNVKGLHGGFLRDTLVYDYESPEVTYISGRGELTTVIRDTVGNIIGQSTTPLAGAGGVTSAINLPLDSDDNGNWTERLVMWTVQTPGRHARVYQMIEYREIEYYK